ncbi:hypothetical protein MUN89_09720 [Halobacillus salinarum]|uniref:Sporulation membrane protein YtrI C-terminal domain-containing protein n=1 Tax=Halobacillus salinarum TaxID=2932257 RepID=A0ABY4ENX8_9BACI|nr:sporulation membrane protein YtrI [Halobacillus salinarum]UOQ46161.1 hypothetical protein MUN89_09720 [Halobacillus salinarum]
MYIPPFIRKKEARRFFAGVMLGTILGYLFFIFIHGQLHEKYAEENIKLNADLVELESKYEGLLNNEKEENEQSKDSTVEEISVHYSNAKRLQVDLLTQHQLTTLIKQQLESIPGKEIHVVASQTDLIVAAIENKRFVVEDFTYQLTVQKLIVGHTVSLQLMITIEK